MSAEMPKGTAYDLLNDIARIEAKQLEEKRKDFPDSDILINQLASLYVVLGNARRLGCCDRNL